LPNNASKGLPTLAVELKDMVVTYAKQETIDPLRSLVRFVALGVGGSILLSLGLSILVLGGLRYLQMEQADTFDGDWSWSPYAIAGVFCVLVCAFSARAIGAAKRRDERAKRSRKG